MDQERREISTADLARTAEADDRAEGNAVATAARQPAQEAGARTMLFPNDEAERFRSDWTEVQSAFVDAPRNAVERADQLVANTMKRMAHVFADERRKLEEQWDRGGDVTTEDLRVALQRYRAFFDRLLSV
jgi:hypothetical protein